MSQEPIKHPLEEVASPNIQDVWELLRDMQEKMDRHIEQEELYKPKMLELITILERSKGIMYFFKVLIYFGVPISAAIAWFSDHFRWKV